MADFSPKKEAGKAAGRNPKVTGEDTQDPPHIFLQSHHVAKLFKQLPSVGDKVKISGLAHVGSVSENQDHGDGGKPRRTITLHLHKMEVGTGKQPEMSDDSQKAGAKAEIDKALKKAESKD